MAKQKPYTISTSNDDRNKKGEQMLSFKHDNRDEEAVAQANDFDRMEGREPHIHKDKKDLNENIIQSENELDAYEKIFGESVNRYNAGQKRSDRKTSVEKELQKIKDSKLQEPCYTMIVQVGNKDYRPDDKTCKAILKKYVEEWQKRFPNMKIVNAVIHMDEDGAPHLHIIYIPVKTKEGQLRLQKEAYEKECEEQKKAGKEVKPFKATRWQGIDVQNSFSGALEEMGYDNSKTVTYENEKGEMVTKHDYKNGALTQWQADFNGLLEEICTKKEYGFELSVHHPQAGEDVCHQETNDYKHDQQIRKELKEEIDNLRLDKFDLENEKNELKADRDRYKAEAEEERKKAKEAREEAEAEKTQNKALKAENEALTLKSEKAMEIIEDSCAEADTVNNFLFDTLIQLGAEVSPPLPTKQMLEQKEVKNQNVTADEVNQTMSYALQIKVAVEKLIKGIFETYKPRFEKVYKDLQPILAHFFVTELKTYEKVVAELKKPMKEATDTLETFHSGKASVTTANLFEKAVMSLEETKSKYEVKMNEETEEEYERD